MRPGKPASDFTLAGFFLSLHEEFSLLKRIFCKGQRMSNTAQQTVTLSIMLTAGANIEFEVATVEQAIIAFRKLAKHLDHCGATYSIEGETGFHQI